MRATRSVRILVGFLATILVLATLAVPPVGAQDEPPLQPDQPTATYGSAVSEAAIVYLEIYYAVWVLDPQLGIYFNNGFPYETVVTCTGWAVGPNRVVTASHCIQVDVQAGTVPYDIIVGPATDFAINNNLYPGLTRAEIENRGLSTWEVEGEAADSAPVREIFASYCTVTSGLRGQSGTSTARLVDHVPLDQGDVALISIEDPGSLAQAPIPILEVVPGTPAVGSEILSVGYPGAVGAATTGQVRSPSIQDGRISSVTTAQFGGYQVFEVSSTLGSGMSGGPTVDFSGRVVGVNSFGVIGNLDTFKFVSPADRYVGELLARNGVSNELSGTDITYRQGLTQFLSGNYTAAIELFDETLLRMPAHCRAQEFRLQAVQQRDEVGDTPTSTTAPPVTEPPATEPPATEPPPTTEVPATEPPDVVALPPTDSDEGSSVLPIVLIGAGLAAIVAAAGVYMNRSRRPAPAAALPAAAPMPSSL
ncbi:MAG: trypsin-like peptidase domain-containing protein, partial [Acidimicrobiia bacterium]|nr:trypsin-like peptidase domain-containing protein [Acidimicrobiia bacterium]